MTETGASPRLTRSAALLMAALLSLASGAVLTVLDWLVL